MFHKFQTTTDTAQALATQRVEGPAAMVLLKLMSRMNHSNMVKGTPKELSTYWNLTLGEFTLGIRGLKGLDIIRKYTKQEYMLNPDIMYNGDDQRYYILKVMWDGQTTRGFRNE